MTTGGAPAVPGVKDCCREAANLGPPVRDRPDRPELVYRRCQVCQCRHFELSVDPGAFGVQIAPVG